MILRLIKPLSSRASGSLSPSLSPTYKLYSEGDVVALEGLFAEAASLADRSTGKTRRRAMSVAEEARLYIARLAAGKGPPPPVAGRGEDSLITPTTGAFIGGVLGFAVGVFLGSLGGDASDISELNAVVVLFFGVIGLIVGALVGLLLGMARRNRARSHQPSPG